MNLSKLFNTISNNLKFMASYISFAFKHYFFKKEIKYIEFDIELGDPEIVDSDSLYKSIYENMDLGFTYKFALFIIVKDYDTPQPICINGLHYYFEYPIPNDFAEYSFELSEDKGWIKYSFFNGEEMETSIELSKEDKEIVSKMSLDSNNAEEVKTKLALMANNVWISYIFICLEEVIEDMFRKSDIIKGIKLLYGDCNGHTVYDGEYLRLSLGYSKTKRRILDYKPMIVRSDSGNCLTYKDLNAYGFVRNIIRVINKL